MVVRAPLLIAALAGCGGGGGEVPDDAAPPPGPWIAMASDGTSEDFIEMSVTGPDINAHVSYQWQQMEFDGYGRDVPADLPGATGPTFQHQETYAARPYRYRCQVLVSGYAITESTIDWGWRRPRADETPRADLWSTDGTVRAIAVDDGVLYLGGDFGYVGPPTGAYAAIGLADGAADQNRARLVPEVGAATSDGAGGWYLGGRMIFVDGVLRGDLVHIDAAGALDPLFAPPLFDGESRIAVLMLRGDTLYVGGQFDAIGGQSRHSLAAVDATTGALQAWNPDVMTTGTCCFGTEVNALLVAGNTLYIGGHFTSVGGSIRNDLAAVNLDSGATTDWNPNPEASQFCDLGECWLRSTFHALAMDGGTIYAGGEFSAVGGEERYGLAAFDSATGALLPLDMPMGEVDSLALDGGTLYVAGNFDTIGNSTRQKLAAIDTATGTLTAWNPGADDRVRTIVVDTGIMYIGGDFQYAGGESRLRLAAIDAITGGATAWNPGAAGSVHALAVDGASAYAGGEFSSAGGLPRTRLAAIDLATGAVTGWDPGADDTVSALAVDGGTVYAGGSFTTIGGLSRSRIAAIDGVSGTVTAWDADADGDVHAIEVDDSAVLAGGAFASIGGQARARIAALDKTTGSATAWDPGAENTVNDLLLLDGALYVAVGQTGGTDPSYAAAIDPLTGVESWRADADGAILALGGEGGDLAVGGYYFHLYYKQVTFQRDYLAMVDATTGEVRAWDPTFDVGFIVNELLVQGERVYLGTGALDRATGAPAPWYPWLYYYPQAFASDGAAIYVGGGFRAVSGYPHGGIASFPSPP